IIISGHDTTANTMVWLLYKLSRHPEDQAKIREEITQTKANALGALTSNDYGSMPWMYALIKALYLHPLAYILYRMAGQDDVLPLAEPIITSDDQLSSENPISKGQVAAASVYTLESDRTSSVWGSDADEWESPSILRRPPYKASISRCLCEFVGVFRPILSWRFGVMELQWVVTKLLDKFEFSIPKGIPELRHGPVNFVLTPVVPGKAHEGPQMPLLATPLKK
ncbi:cytochrome P450, partial [Desarmillaria ectypa]